MSYIHEIEILEKHIVTYILKIQKNIKLKMQAVFLKTRDLSVNLFFVLIEEEFVTSRTGLLGN